MRLRTAGFGVLIGLIALIPGRPAGAHGSAGSTDFRTDLTDVEGTLDGAELLVRDLGARLEVVRTTATEIVVLGYEGEPYLRLDEEGVWRNSSSPATYLNEDRYGSVTLPDNADATAAPTWDHVGSGDRFAWHDHRAHWMSPAAPPIASSEPDVEHVVYEDRVRLEIDGRDVSVGTRVTWVPTPPQTLWLLATGAMGALAIGAVLLRPAVAPAVGLIATGAATIARLSGPVWLVVAIVGIAAAGWALLRRSVQGAGIAGFAAVVTSALRLDLFEHSLVPGGVPATVQRIALLIALGLGAAAIVGALAAPSGRRSLRPSVPSSASS